MFFRFNRHMSCKKALVDKKLKNLIHKNIISSEFDLYNYVQPASIDIPLGSEAFILKQKFIPFSRPVSNIIKKLSIGKIDISKETILYKGQTYLFPSLFIDIPKNISIKLSPKSSLGRVDVLIRTIFDNSGLYDFIPGGSKGRLWIQVTPQSFNIIVKKGLTLNQMRVFKSVATRECLTDDVFLLSNEGVALKQRFIEKNKLLVSLSVDPKFVLGYEAITTNEPINLTKTGFHDWHRFFRKLDILESNDTSLKGRISLEKDHFYILATKERIHVPLNFSVEMMPFSHLIGELRAHYAGFFDPGFGIDGGAHGVLEIRPHETISVYDGQPICLIEVFCNEGIPSVAYGSAGNNYQGQTGPRLAKYFKI